MSSPNAALALATTLFFTITLAAPLTGEVHERAVASAQDFSGKITWYSPSVGYNSCGSIEPDSALITAVSPAVMGAQSSKSPLVSQSNLPVFRAPLISRWDGLLYKSSTQADMMARWQSKL